MDAHSAGLSDLTGPSLHTYAISTKIWCAGSYLPLKCSGHELKYVDVCMR